MLSEGEHSKVLNPFKNTALVWHCPLSELYALHGVLTLAVLPLLADCLADAVVTMKDFSLSLSLSLSCCSHFGP
jgi:hypothetical protein